MDHRQLRPVLLHRRRYRLRLVPGRYELTASAENHVSATAAVAIRDGEETGQDFSLAAAAAALEPLEVSASVALGETQDLTLTV